MKKPEIITVITTGIILVVIIVMALTLNTAEIGITAVFGPSPIYKGKTDEKRMAFMCNVYWGNEYIEPILDILKEYGVHITFFIGGSWARDNGELLDKIYAAGHEIGNHGYYHYDHDKLTPEKSSENILRNHELIRDRLGIEMDLFAPPSGAYNASTVETADSLGYRTVLWTIDTIDWRDKDTDLIVSRVWNKRENGALVLMHPTAHTVKALSVLLRDLTADGYEIGTVGSIIK